MINVKDLETRATEIDQLGVDYICVHTGYDLQAEGKNSFEELTAIKKAVKSAKTAIAGGIKLDTLPEAIKQNPDLIIVGGGITGADNKADAAAKMKQLITRIMKTTEYLHDILNELSRTASLIADSEADKLADQILSADQIFTSGAGRSGFMAKAFAMRMMHIGLNAYIVGETLTPPLQEGGLVIIGSGSGETKSLLHTAEKAKNLNGIITALTINPASSLGKLADLTITIPGSPKEETGGDRKTIQPMGSLFEQTLLLFYDAVILKIMEKKELNSADMFTKHANLE